MSVNQQNPLRGQVFEIECVKDRKSAALNWTCCDLKQFCAKVQELNDMDQDEELRNARNDAGSAQRRSEGDDAAGDFREAWNNIIPDFMRNEMLPESGVRNHFYADCAYENARANDFEIGPEMQADHVHELQLGGHPSDFGNFKWLSASVNGSIGSTLSNYDPQTSPGGISADCCPAEARGRCSSPANDNSRAF